MEPTAVTPRIVLSTNSKGVVSKVQKQLVQLGIAEENISAQVKECRVVVTGVEVEKVVPVVIILNHVERAFVEVNSCGKKDAVAMLENLELAATFAENALWDPFIAAYKFIHNRAPLSWTLDARLRVKRSTDPSKPSLSKIDLQNAARQGLHTGLLKRDITHNPYRPDFLVFLSVTESVCSLAAPILCRRTVSKLVHKGLHHTVSWGVGRTAKLLPGEVVLDACVGKAALLLECAQFWDECHYIGLDICHEQIACARENIANCPKPIVNAMLGDATHLPVRTASIDCVVSDLPFGRAMSSPDANRTFYPSLCAELRRALRPGGRAVLLTGEESDVILGESLQKSGFSVIGRTVFPFGGNKDRLSCTLYMAVVDVGEDDAVHRSKFDWRFPEKVKESAGAHTWKNEKPCLAPYQAKRYSKQTHKTVEAEEARKETTETAEGAEEK